MSSAAPTREQQSALDARGTSVALESGAGCGKTFVLTERFLAHLRPSGSGSNEQPRLDQLVAITFTDAAAREMRSRIRTACYQRLTDSDRADEQDHWLRLLREIDSARVSTIHSFCTTLLRAHAAEANLDPTFAVLDQGATDVLQSEVIDDVLRSELIDQFPDTMDLAAAGGLARLKQQVATLLGQRHEDYVERWLNAGPMEVVAAWKHNYDNEAHLNAIQAIATSAPVADLLQMLTIATPRKENALFQTARNVLNDLLPALQAASINKEQLDSIYDSARVQGICTAKDWPSSDDSKEYTKVCKVLRDAIDKHKPSPWNPNTALEAADLGLKLLRLTHRVGEAFETRKAAQGALDFDDLLSQAYRLISNPNNDVLRDRISDQLQLLLVDEFQDTDRLQLNLIKLLCGGVDAGRLFFVGDFKQSIYRFRGAEPPGFLELKNQVPDPGQRSLTENFRSLPGILDFVNALFCEALGNDKDHPYQALRPHRTGPDDQPAVEFLWTITPNKKSNEKGATEAARRLEANAIARRLRELVSENCQETPIVDKDGQARTAKLGDVAILFRALSDVQLYEEALRDHGLEYYLVGGHAFYSQQEIYDVLNLLRAVASSADEISLAGVLRSPFFALLDETLFWLVNSACSLNAGLLAKKLPAPLSDEERAKVLAAAETIRHLRAIKDIVPVATLLSTALARTGYDAVLLSEFLGERKLANLQKLLEQARATDQSDGRDLDSFITQLAQFIAQQPKEALAATLPEAANVIRLMTIHHAKGLEFPVVVLPDLDRPSNFRAPAAALDRDLGPLVSPPQDDDQEKFATGMELFTAKEKREDAEEDKRLLYVATTRAADYLILSSSLEAHDKFKSDWMKLLAERFDLQNGAFTGHLPAGYAQPRVRVHCENETTDRSTVGKSRRPDLLHILAIAHELSAIGDAILPREVDPIPVDRSARRQFSFSRLTGQLVRHEAPRSILTTDSFNSATPPRIDPRGLGTLVHDVLERIDFRNPHDISELCELLATEHVEHHVEDTARLATELIERFLKSPRGKQLADAKSIQNEVEFLLSWPPDASRDALESTGRYLQGFIDCLYQDDHGDWHILDYKTNDVTKSEVAKAAKQYELQLYVYAMAIERALGQPPTELTLHFLRPSIEHTFPWNEAVRTSAIKSVNQAIASLTTND